MGNWVAWQIAILHVMIGAMAGESSFDIVCQVDLQELDNAIHQATKEISQRFDFRGSQSKIERKDQEISLVSDDEFKLKNVTDILEGKMVKRGVSLKFLEYGPVDAALGGTVKQKATLRQGIDREQAKTVNTLIKETGLKVQSQIQGDQVRVSSKNKDDLQKIIQLLRGEALPIPLQFVNYR